MLSSLQGTHMCNFVTDQSKSILSSEALVMRRTNLLNVALAIRLHVGLQQRAHLQHIERR